MKRTAVKIIIGVFLSSLTVSKSIGQIATLDKVQAEKIRILVPDNYEIMALEFGHLNNDFLEDAVLIIKSKFEELEDSSQRDLYRPLLIIIQQDDNSFKTVKRNDNIVLCKNCGGAFSDPYEGLSIENKTFQVRFSGGSRYRWTRQIEFSYDSGISNWLLIDDSGNVYDGLQLDTLDYPKDIIYSTFDKEKNKVTIDNYKGDN